MADNTIIIDIEVSSKDALKAIRDTEISIQSLKAEQEELTKAYANGEKTQQEYIAGMKNIKKQMNDLNAVQKANLKVIEENDKAAGRYKDSLNGMRQQLKDLTKAYDNMTQAERTSAKGTELLSKIQGLNNELMLAEAETGRFQRNVGNYPQVFDIASGTMGKFAQMAQALTGGTGKLSVGLNTAKTAVQAFGKQLLALLKNPIVAIIAAIAVVVMKLVDAFKKSDDAMTSLQKAFAAFQPILTAINIVFEKLAETLGKIVLFAANAVTAVLRLVPAFRESQDAAQGLVQAEDELQDTEREYTIESAKNSRRIAELRSKATEKDKYNAKERMQMLDEALELERKNMEQEKNIAAERFRIAKEKAKADRDTTDETKDHLAELEAAMYAAEESYYTGIRRLQQQAKSARDEERKAELEAQKEREQKAKEWAQKQVEIERKTLEERRKLEDMQLEMLQDGYEKQRQIVAKQYERQIEDLNKRLETEKNLSVEAKKSLSAQIILLQAKQNLELAKLDEQFTKENLQKQLEYWQKYNANQILLMSDGYAKRKAQLDNANKAELDANFILIEQLEAQRKKYIEEGNTAEADRVKTEIRREQSLLQQKQMIYAQDLANLKKEYDERLAELTHANELEQQLYNLDLQNFKDKESAKAQIIQEEAEKRLALLQQEQLAAQEALANDPSNIDLQLRLQQLTAQVINGQKDVAEATKNTQQALANEQAQGIKTFSDIAKGINNALGGFEELFTEMAQDNSKMSDFATAMALMQIQVTSAIAVVEAIAAATKAGGQFGVLAPAMIPAFIAELVGIVMGNIVSTIQTIKKAKAGKPSTPKFAEGGLVGNQFSNRTDDSVDAKLSVGESVMNSKATMAAAPLLSAINQMYGGAPIGSDTQVGRTDAMREMMADVFAEIQPVVSVREITRVSNRVKVKEQLSKS